MKSSRNKKQIHNFQKLVEEARELIETFKLHDPKPWSLEIKAIDLASHIGSINQAILERQGYKQKGIADQTLNIELATAFFIILDIAQQSKVEFETTFFEFLKETRKRLTEGEKHETT